MSGCSIIPTGGNKQEKPKEDETLTMGDVTELQIRTMIIGQICKLNQQLDPPLHITMGEARRQTVTYPLMRTGLMTSSRHLHKEQLTGGAAQIDSESPREAWIRTIRGIPSGNLCPWCGDIFQWGGSRRRHLRKVHVGERSCIHCEIPFCSQRLLTKHLAVRQQRGSCYLNTGELNQSNQEFISKTKSGQSEEDHDSS